LVSFGNVWKYLTLTGTFWAQASFSKKWRYIFLKPPFLLSKSSF